jgi:tripartite motif-containing protein 71
MKKIIFSMLLVFGGFLSWACNNSSTPSGPTGGPRGGGPVAPTPTFAVAPPAYVGGLPTAFGPNGLAIAGGTTYVAEADNNGNEVEVFSAGLTVGWTTFGSAATFIWPIGVASNSAGTTVYVLDNGDQNNDGTAAVYAFTGAGATITSWNTYGGTKFFNPSALTLDALGNVYVADTNNDQVEEFGPTGATITTWTKYSGTSFNGPSALAFDSTGDLYVGDLGNGTVDEFSGNNSTGPTQTGVYQWGMVNNCYIDGLAVDGSGNIYVADYGETGPDQLYFGNGRMEEYGPNGGPQLTAWSYGTDFGPDAVLLTGGSIWVADYNNDAIDQF